MSKQPVAELSRVITAKGYAIRKDRISAETLAKIKKDLTASPKMIDKFAKGALASFPLYQESSTRIYTPRQWAIAEFGEPEANIVSEGIDLPSTVSFKGTPYPYQEAIITTFINEGGNGLICVPCGRGKTFMALNIAIRLKKRFLIVVDKEFLMNQWKGEIENYIQGLRVGILQGSKQELDPTKYDCTICMIQTVCQRDFQEGIFKCYGFTIFDECHHLGAQHFSQVLNKIQTRNMLGLSATPDRDDGLTKVFEYFLGKPVYQEKIRDPDPSVIVRAVWYRNEDPEYSEPPVDWRGEVITARLLTQIVNCKERTQKIIDMVKEMAANPDRKILILSERKAHLQEICDSLKDYTRGYYVGGMKQEDLDKNAETCQILLATYAMASEAMNIKTLNAMIMASPRKKVEQSTGRILRVTPDKRKVAPLIVDVIDQHDMYINQWYKRLKYYKQCQYTIEHVNKLKKTVQKVLPTENGCLIQLDI